MHRFSLLAELGGRRRAVVDVEAAGRSAEISVVALYAKALDVGADRSVLVTASPVTEMAERLLRLYKMLLFHPETPAEELGEQLAGYLRPGLGPPPRLIR